ncbi:type IV conjugative transfer system protein TraL [Shewanella algae]|nr:MULTISPECIES: type IV conjugative transfer system protein TraL [Shewanella]AYV11426.1 type IV conjugative transfer system protein TraL [Shewanella algae]MBO2656154.1 type IV conjugative transfer system protein TraL [Shewanella algae]QXN27370.1 type IV conjugative transfer system protein TraL [Shewanella putrefaciens]
MNTYRVPRRINDPLIVFFVTLDQFIPIFIALILGYTFKAAVEATLFAFMYFKITNYFTTNHPRGYVEHALWYWGLMPLKLGSKAADPLKREFIK